MMYASRWRMLLWGRTRRSPPALRAGAPAPVPLRPRTPRNRVSALIIDPTTGSFAMLCPRKGMAVDYGRSTRVFRSLTGHSPPPVQPDRQLPPKSIHSRKGTSLRSFCLNYRWHSKVCHGIIELFPNRHGDHRRLPATASNGLAIWWPT